MTKNNLQEIYNEFGKDICLAPFFSTWMASVSPKGQIVSNSLRPCPVIQGDWTNKSNTIQGGINSEQWVKLRQHFTTGSCFTNPECSACAYSEKSNSKSTRHLSNQSLAENMPIDIIDAVKTIIDNDYTMEDIYVLEYFPSNYCNYQCIMCNGMASSARGIFERKYLGRKTGWIDNQLEPDFYEVISKLNILSLTGGETILQPQLHDLIDYLIKHDIAKNVTVTMLTNVSSFPESLVEKFKQFKAVFYTLSIDGTGDVIEYQRRGAKWDEVKENAALINKNFGTVINYVLTAVNVFSFEKFVNWAHSINADIVFITMENDTGYLGVESIPNELMQPLIEKLTNKQSEYTTDWCIGLFDELLTILKRQTHNPAQLETFIEHIRIEDKVSKKSLVEVVPEWKPYFE